VAAVRARRLAVAAVRARRLAVASSAWTAVPGAAVKEDRTRRKRAARPLRILAVQRVLQAMAPAATPAQEEGLVARPVRVAAVSTPKVRAVPQRQGDVAGKAVPAVVAAPIQARAVLAAPRVVA